MTVITMSRKELARLHVMIDLADGRITVDQAGTLMELGRRQVFRQEKSRNSVSAVAFVVALASLHHPWLAVA